MKAKHYAYLAGLLDGDGCIDAYVARSGGATWYRTYLSVNSVEHKVIKRLEEWFGGKGHKRERDHYKNGIIWEWRLIAKSNAAKLIKQVIPYLILKRSQAELAVEFLALSGKCPSDREALIRKIQELNQRDDARSYMPEMGRLKWPYLAGLMDAEGTFTVRKDDRKGYTHYGIWARFANTDERIVRWLEHSFGGKAIHDEKSHYWPLPYERKAKEAYLLQLLPYLITKKEQAKVLLEYIRMGDEKSPSKREALFQRCFALNHPATEVTTLCD